jgi:hypothetical protein
MAGQLLSDAFLIVPSRGPYDVLGMRQRGRTMRDARHPGEPGWLGNPYVAEDAGGLLTRAEATARFGEDVRRRAAESEEWKQAFLGLQGKRVGYYKPNEKDIHLHELQRWILENRQPPAPRVYAGIGSRETPPQVLSLMTELAQRMEPRGWLLRSGGARGADQAFEAGIADPAHRSIFLPGQSFMGRRAGSGGFYDSHQLPGWQAALETVAQYHPAPDRLPPFARDLMARNAMQVLGPNLDSPAKMVVAWAPGGYENDSPPRGVREGGTGQALRIARDRGIEIRNLANPATLERAQRWLQQMRAEG